MSYFQTAKCGLCGKAFYPTSEHVYKQDEKRFCSWSCLCAYRRNKEERRKRPGARIKNKERDIELAKFYKESGLTMKKVAELRNMSVYAVHEAIVRGRKYLEEEAK